MFQCKKTCILSERRRLLTFNHKQCFFKIEYEDREMVTGHVKQTTENELMLSKPTVIDVIYTGLTRYSFSGYVFENGYIEDVAKLPQ